MLRIPAPTATLTSVAVAEAAEALSGVASEPSAGTATAAGAGGTAAAAALLPPMFLASRSFAAAVLIDNLLRLRAIQSRTAAEGCRKLQAATCWQGPAACNCTLLLCMVIG